MLLSKKTCLSNVSRGQRIRRMTSPRSLPYDSVVFDYVSSYAQFVCRPAVLQECVDHMVVPEPAEQLRVLQGMFDVFSRVDPIGLEGVFMKLLLVRDYEAVDTLVDSLQSYHDSVEMVNAIIRYSYNLPLEGTNIKL